jgi:hypothetical protein
MIARVNWDPRTPVPLAEAAKLLESLEFLFTAALAPANPFLAQAVWVRCVPVPAPGIAAPSAQPVVGLVGTASISGDILAWKTAEAPVVITALRTGGVILIDLDCDYVQDSTGAAVSGSAARLAGIASAIRPGGIFRSWIEVSAG